MPPTADTVGQLLADKATRLATLDALEAHTGAFENELRASASRALGGLLDEAEADVDEPTLRRMLLLLARFFDEASDETELFAELVEGRGGLERLFTRLLWFGGTCKGRRPSSAATRPSRTPATPGPSIP